MSGRFYTCAFGDFATDLDDVFIRKDFVVEGGLYAAGARFNDITVTSCSSTFSPVTVSGNYIRWKQISGGSPTNNYAIDCEGLLYAWGTNSDCLLGTCSTIATARSTPALIAGTTPFKWKCVYGQGNCIFPGGAAAIRCDGTLWAWGRNDCGRLGNGNVSNANSPVQVLPTTGGNCWKEVAMGYEHTLGIKTDGTLWAWGKNRVGQLGDGTTVSKSTPIQIGFCRDWYKLPKNMGTGERSFAIKCDGTLWSWGLNGTSQQLGDSTTTCRSSPVQVITSETFCEVATGAVFGIAITRSGKLYTWGRNCHGLLGINCSDGTFVSTPVVPCCGETGWKTLAIHTNAGSTNTVTGSGGVVAIKKDGSAWAWGYDCCTGALGLGGTGIVCYSTPVQIAGANNWIAVSITSPYADGPTYMLRGETTTLTCDAYDWYNTYRELM